MSENKSKKSFSLATLLGCAMMMAIIMVMTFIVRIPTPATEGYIHLGDCMIFMGVLILGWKYGAVAAAFGSALADIIGGYAYFAPITFVVKGLMAVIMGLFLERAFNKGSRHSIVLSITGMVLGGLTMVAGYFVAEGIMYGSFVTAAVEIPMNILQFAVGILIAMPLASALCKTNMRKVFAYNVNESGLRRVAQAK